jgi:L-alanine-DL-glutamate epimerase-like enolase superfamily enzyme
MVRPSESAVAQSFKKRMTEREITEQRNQALRDEGYEEVMPGVFAIPDRVRAAYERYLKDGTPYIPILLQESQRNRERLKRAIEQRARERR